MRRRTPEFPPGRDPSLRVVFSAEGGAGDLWRYGEDDLIEPALQLLNDELLEVWVIAGNLYHDASIPLPVHHQRPTLGHCVALALILHLEGTMRPLARERRRPEKDMPAPLRNAPIPPLPH